MLMSEQILQLQAKISEKAKPDIKLNYNMNNLAARKIVVLIKFAGLDYQLEENAELESPPHLFHTPQGDLHEEYQIIHFIVNESRRLTLRQSDQLGSEHQLLDQSVANTLNNVAQFENIISLCGDDSYLIAKMTEELFLLRQTLFPILQQFYKSLLGHQRIRKSKYDTLCSRIKKEVAKLETLMNEHSQLFQLECSFLNILIVCQLHLAFTFVFEQKFRKSKHSLFSCCENISKRKEFEEIYGKSSFCVKEYVPSQFEPEQQPEMRKNDQTVPLEIIRMSEAVVSVVETNRNQLLYNYFRSIFEQQHQSKLNYFSYFWLMFDRLGLTLVQMGWPASAQHSQSELSQTIKIAQSSIKQIIKSVVDYGLLGVYQHEKDKNIFEIRGLLFLGSHHFQEMKKQLQSGVDIRSLKMRVIDPMDEDERRKVEWLLQNVTEHNTNDGVTLCEIVYI